MSSGTTYILEGAAVQSQLAAGAGKRVEVTGTLDSSASTSDHAAGATTAGTTGATPTSGAAGSASAMNAQHLRVASVRVVGESCSVR
jgi:hypothetical protein